MLKYLFTCKNLDENVSIYSAGISILFLKIFLGASSYSMNLQEKNLFFTSREICSCHTTDIPPDLCREKIILSNKIFFILLPKLDPYKDGINS